MKAYPLRFPEKAPKGTKQGTKSSEGLTQGREIGVYLTFSLFPAGITRIEQDLRSLVLYPAELRRQLHPAILHAGREKVNGRLPPFIRLPSRCKCIPAFHSHRKEVCESNKVFGCTKKERLQNADALSMGLIAAPCRRGYPQPWVPGTSWK